MISCAGARLLVRLLSSASILICPNVLHAQDGGIHKCTTPDGNVIYQQYDCPAGTTDKTLSVSSSTSSTLTLIPNSNHQYSTTLTINGVTVPGYIDTGATFVAMSPETAARMHITGQVERNSYMQTANGVAVGARKTVSVVKVGKFELYNVEIVIMQNTPTLIGMTALSQLKFANENGNLVLSKR